MGERAFGRGYYSNNGTEAGAVEQFGGGGGGVVVWGVGGGSRKVGWW